MYRGMAHDRSRLPTLHDQFRTTPGSRFTASHAAMPFFAAMLRRGDHEDGTMPSSYLRALFPTISDALPANYRARSPTMSQTTLACAMTNALLMHVSRPSARFPYQSGHHHRSCITGRLGCRCSNCAPSDIPQIRAHSLDGNRESLF